MRVLAVAFVALGWSAAVRAQSVGLAWVEPEVGVAAAVVAGEALVVRARLPIALTPPPGVQQPRALEGWSGTLVGQAWSVDAGAVVTHGYFVAVSDVRPDGGASLVYRARLELPPWVAPGEYALTLATPGGELRDARVRVGGATPGPVQARREGDALRIAVDAAHATPVHVAIGASGSRPVEVLGAAVEWHPAASELSPSERAVVGVARLAPGEALVARLLPAREEAPTLRLPAGAVEAGTRVALEVTGADPGTRVAWEVGGRAVGWNAGAHAHVFARGGRERVRALVVTADGVSTPLSEVVEVHPAGQRGCGVGHARSTDDSPRTAWAAALIVVGLLLKTKRRRAFGNRVARKLG